MTCPVEFQMWMPLPRRFWSSATTHSSPSPGFSPLRKRIGELRRLGRADDGVALDPGAVGLRGRRRRADDSMIRLSRTTTRAPVTWMPAWSSAEIEARAADLEPLDRHVGGADGDDVRRAVADERSRVHGRASVTGRAMVNGPV